MKRGVLCAAVALLAGCPVTDGTDGAGGAGPKDVSGGGGVGGLPELKAFVSQDPKLVSIAERLPEGWAGTGTLEVRENVVEGAPAWVRVKAEVMEEAGQRFLRASGEARRIRNSSLARSAADNRARAELSQWLGTGRLVGSEVIERWGIPGQNTYALARIPVPSNWQPGMDYGAADADADADAEPNTDTATATATDTDTDTDTATATDRDPDTDSAPAPNTNTPPPTEKP